MADSEQVKVLRRGVKAWNRWRKEHPSTRPDLEHADLVGASLGGVDLRGAKLAGALLVDAQLQKARLADADLTGADLSWSNMYRADLRHTTLSGASLFFTSCVKASFIGADLSGANLRSANFYAADLSGARVVRADLTGAALVETNLARADVSASRVYGISAWDLDLEGTVQDGLIITRDDHPDITVDDLEVAQFLFLLMENARLRGVIDTITSKVVLILGRFTTDRKAVLDAIREELRLKHDYVPVVFDFDKPLTKTTGETIQTLARMARFVIADITAAKSVLQELESFVAKSPSLPVQPIILETESEPGMFDTWLDYPWFLDVYRYSDEKALLASVADSVIRPVEDYATRIAQRRAKREEAATNDAASVRN